jgi:hypothetical protein
MGDIWIISLPDIKGMVAFDDLLLLATFLDHGRTVAQFTGR